MAQSDIESLLVHEPFVRAVARALLQGDGRVDDVVQETWVAALRSRPRHPEAARSWLAGIARNVARTLLRRDRSRSRREHRVEPPRGIPSPEEIQAQEEIRRKVLTELLALDEPYRSALILRYYEDLPPREIAEHLGVPVETARTRVRRGLERLRARLDAQHQGDRRKWAVALLPFLLFRRPAVAATAAAAGTTMLGGYLTLRWLAAAAVLATLAVVGVVSLTGGGVEDPANGHPEPAPDTVAPSARSPEDEAEAGAVEAEDLVELSGRVVGPGGVPVAGADVAALSVPPPSLYRSWNQVARLVEGADPAPVALAAVTSGAGGGFSLAMPRGSRVRLEARAKGLVSFARKRIDTTQGARGIVLTLHEEIQLTGIVMDAAGHPLADARVRTKPPWNAWREAPPRETRTDESGRFRIGGLIVGAVSLLVEHHGHSPRYYYNVRTSSRDFRIVMEAGLPVEGTVVLGSAEEPVTDALVTIAPANSGYAPVTAPTDERGRFRIERVGSDTPFRFVASARSARHGLGIESEVVWAEDEPVVIRMDAGRVLEGTAVLVNGHGDEVPAPGARLIVFHRAEWYSEIWYASNKGGICVETDEEGRFRVAGVTAGEGTVQVDDDDPRYAFDPEADEMWGGAGFDAETEEVEVRVVEKHEVRGRVVGPDGAPAAGAEIRLGTERGFSRDLASGAVFSNADGRFLFDAVAPTKRGPVHVHARLPGVGGGSAEVGPDLEVVLGPYTVRSGVVTDVDEQPLSGVLVRAPGPWSETASTDEEGKYRLEAGEGHLTF
ncbi:MAG: sigma-70 family RNA polymerase sigma factor, partial [Planctomycetota bacterium]